MTKPPPTTKITPAIRDGLLMGPTHGEKRELQRTAKVPFDAPYDFRRDAKPTHDAIEGDVRYRNNVARFAGQPPSGRSR